jgi:type II secretion system protein G
MTKLPPIIVSAILLFSACSKAEEKPKAPKTPPFTAVEEAKVKNTEIQMMNIAQALDIYRVKYAVYPTTEEGLKILVDKQFLAEIPEDAWGNKFVYELVDPRTYKLKSLGADGKPGGKGFDKDIEHKQ